MKSFLCFSSRSFSLLCSLVRACLTCTDLPRMTWSTVDRALSSPALDSKVRKQNPLNFSFDFFKGFFLLEILSVIILIDEIGP